MAGATKCTCIRDLTGPHVIDPDCPALAAGVHS